ncbi:hypothetical protein Y032_0055g2617 [Ancylostoma ceylanicum]|uniref:Uncharacterized protein n=1 Tax=Ancylostoma ceylanicum TaxID=53326 RepID=A0A016U6M7_9BILA|nr:hypothetical protein Y032_0055g2617 [Ancylostoma ceylanicum]
MDDFSPTAFAERHAQLNLSISALSAPLSGVKCPDNALSNGYTAVGETCPRGRGLATNLKKMPKNRKIRCMYV